jgi:pimeloyl-ACP methyl ester carboxylesterase
VTSGPYGEHGPAEAEVVVLLHGWPGGPATWRRLAPALATRFRVLAPELREPSLHRQADQVVTLLRDLGIDRYAVVGHGHGAAVAQILVTRQPSPAAFVLLDAVTFEGAAALDGDPAAIVGRAAVEFASLSADEVAAYEVFGRSVPRPLPTDLHGPVAALAGSDAPVFLLWGEDDAIVPLSVGERLGDALPGSALGVVPDSGHFLLDDAFDTVGVMIVEYLRARYQGAPHGHEGVVMLQLERRQPWLEMASPEGDDTEPPPPAEDQEVGRLA